MKSAFLSTLLAAAMSVGAASSPALPLTPIPGSSGCNSLAIDGDRLFAANSSKLTVYDISNPLRPRQCGTMPLRGARQITVNGNHLYVSARHWGVQIIDISEPDSPKPAGWLDTAELATGMESAGNLLCVTLRVYGVQLFDIRDPLHPKHLSLLRTGEAQSAFRFGDKLAIGDWGAAKLTIADISNPHRPKVIGSGRLDGFGDGVWVHGNYCYAATGHHARSGPKAERFGRGHGLEIFDISNPAKPRRVGGVKFPKFYEVGNDFWMVRSDGRTAFVGDTHNGFFLIDVSTPARPREIGHALLPEVERQSIVARKKVVGPDCLTDLAVGDGVVYLAGQKSGLFLIPLGERAKRIARSGEEFSISAAAKWNIPTGLVPYRVADVVRRLAVRGDELFAACSDEGVKRFAIRADGSLTETGTLPGRAYDVAVAGKDLLLVARGMTLDLYRILPQGFRKTGSIAGTFYNPFQVLHPFGNIVVYSGGSSAFGVVDISTPSVPRIVGKDSAGSLLYSDAIPERAIDGRFPVSWHGRGIRWYSIQSGKLERLPSVPRQKLNQLSGITAVGGLFVAPERGGVLLLNPESGEGRSISLAAAEVPQGIPSWDGKHTVVFSDRRNGLVRAYDFRNPERPRPIAGRSFKLADGIPDRVVFHRGRMLIPGWNLGILVEKNPPAEK